MAFIMRAFAVVKLFVLILLFISTSSFAASFTIHNAEVHKVGNGYNLNANIKHSLTPRVKEALDNGVPITFLQQIEIIHSLPLFADYWQWQSTLWSTELRYELRFHALTSQYVVRSVDTGYRQNFISLDEALTAIGTIKALTLPPEHLEKTKYLTVKLRSGLDLLALPTPMRPGALISKKWQLTSEWTNAIWQ